MPAPKGLSDLCASWGSRLGLPLVCRGSLLCPLGFVGSVGPEEGLGLEPSLQDLGSRPQ